MSAFSFCFRSLLVSCLAAAAATACYTGAADDTKPAVAQAPTEPPDIDTSDGGDAEPGDSATVSPAPTGLPCVIETLLETRCRTCHGAAPKRSPMSLVTYEDLAARAPSDAQRTVAEVSLERMKSADAPMPPGNAAKASGPEIEAFTTWLAEGMPRGTCAPADDGGTT